uniref:Uncharacterized protein n=1 Tax=Arundo donax TaxID=35708 RepID=A0A0A8ZCP4_ARUDO
MSNTSHGWPATTAVGQRTAWLVGVCLTQLAVLSVTRMERPSLICSLLVCSLGRLGSKSSPLLACCSLPQEPPRPLFLPGGAWQRRLWSLTGGRALIP